MAFFLQLKNLCIYIAYECFHTNEGKTRHKIKLQEQFDNGASLLTPKIISGHATKISLRHVQFIECS